jgi:hypothetical protein
MAIDYNFAFVFDLIGAKYGTTGRYTKCYLKNIIGYSVLVNHLTLWCLGFGMY